MTFLYVAALLAGLVDPRERDVAALYPGPDVEQVIRETEALYAVWDALRDGKTDYYFVHVRREGLGRVLAAIGPEAFASGRMPPHVPVWRFEVIR